jgi:hypothetical protein
MARIPGSVSCQQIEKFSAVQRLEHEPVASRSQRQMQYAGHVIRVRIPDYVSIARRYLFRCLFCNCFQI